MLESFPGFTIIYPLICICILYSVLGVAMWLRIHKNGSRVTITVFFDGNSVVITLYPFQLFSGSTLMFNHSLYTLTYIHFLFSVSGMATKQFCCCPIISAFNRSLHPLSCIYYSTPTLHYDIISHYSPSTPTNR